MDFLHENYPAIIAASLFLMSEVLPMIPQVRGNGIFHSIVIALKSAGVVSQDRFDTIEERTNFDMDKDGHIGRVGYQSAELIA